MLKFFRTTRLSNLNITETGSVSSGREIVYNELTSYNLYTMNSLITVILRRCGPIFIYWNFLKSLIYVLLSTQFVLQYDSPPIYAFYIGK